MKLRTHLLFALLVIAIVIFGAWPVMVKAEETSKLTPGMVIQGIFPVCTTPDEATKVALIAADEGTDKADLYIADPSTPCGTTVPFATWEVGDLFFVAQGKDKQWVRVVQITNTRMGNVVFMVTFADYERKVIPKGKAV